MGKLGRCTQIIPPCATAPRWHAVGVVQPSGAHTLRKITPCCTVVEFGSASMRTYCAASCWSGSGWLESSASEKTSACGIESEVKDSSRGRVIFLAMECLDACWPSYFVSFFGLKLVA